MVCYIIKQNTSSVGLSVGIQSAGELVSETSQHRIMHSADEDNLSLSDSKISCLCQSIEINNNKHVNHQSQVQKHIGREVKWAECTLIIGTGSWVQVFSLIIDSSVDLWVGIQSAGELVFETSQLRILHSAEEDNPGSNPAFSRGRQLVSFQFGNRLPVPEHRN